MTLRVAGVVMVVAACGGDHRQLSQQAIELTLGEQETMRLDEALAWRFQGVLDRIWEVHPHLACVSVLPEYVPGHLYVPYASTMSLSDAIATAWQKGSLVTGDHVLDSILDEFEFTEVRYFQSTNRESYSLRFEAIVHAQRFADFFSQETGILVEPEPVAGDGDRIEIEEHAEFQSLGGGWWLRFEKRAGACPSGCTWVRHWEVFLPYEGSVALLEEGGHPLFPETLDELCRL
jgi:hypothetical protein